jgi:chemotaxis protein MotB
MGRRSKKKAVNVDAWINTYADMITLILVFFILLFSMSSIDKEKYRLLVKAFTADPATLEQLMMLEQEEDENSVLEPEDLEGLELDIDDIDDLDELYAYLRQYVRENNLEDSVQVEKSENFVYVKFMSTLFFEPNRAVLKPGGKEILDKVGEALGRAEPIIRFIRIDGHTAEASPGNDTVNNRDLSTERSNEVLKFLEAGYIADPAKLYAAGFGLHRPLAPNDSEENRSKNRRVEIIVGKIDLLQEELDKLLKADN